MDKKNFALISILIIAFLLRLWGIDYGLPYFFIGDEQPLVFGALKMAQLKTLLPVLHPAEFRPLYYPPLMPYFNLIFLSPFLLIKYLIGSWQNLTDFSNDLILNPGFVWLVARIFNLFISLAGIYLLYLISRKLFNRKTALFSALFLCLSFFHLQLSHFTRHWIPAVFFVYLVVLFAFYIKDSPQKKYYLWAGLAAGLAFGVSYITIIALALVLLVYFLLRGISFKQALKDKNLWLMLIVFGILAVVFVLLHPQEFFRIAFGEDSTATQTKTLVDYFGSFRYYFKTMLFYEPVILFFGLLGWLIFWLKSKKQALIFLLWPIIYISILYFFFHHESRYIILILPWFCLLAGYGLSLLLEKIKKPLWIALVILLVFIYPLTITLKYDYLLSQPDTRLLAKDWVDKNIAPVSRIITDWAEIKLTPTKEAILQQKDIDEDSLRTDDRTLSSLDAQKYPQPSFNVLPLHFIGQKLPDDLSQYAQENNYQYFVVEYWSKNRLSEQDKSLIGERRPIKSFNSGLGDYSIDINGNVLEPAYRLFDLERFGPVVEIYEL